MKTCSNCKQLKEYSDFSHDRTHSDGLQSWCKSCKSFSKKKLGPDGLKDHQRRALKNPDRQRNYYRERRHGVTPEKFNAMLAEQGNACAICRNTDKKWCIDHDHATGKVRAILCNVCNLTIGLLDDSARRAIAAAEYLTKHGNL